MKVLMTTLAVFSFVLANPAGHVGKIDLRIVKNKPSVFISFDHRGKRQPLEQGESDSGIWLRLHNNTKAVIFIPIFTVPKTLGDVGLFYDIISTTRPNNYHDSAAPAQETKSPELPAGYTLGHTSSAYLLRPGRSISFSVPAEHLPERVGLRVNFSYEWELEGDMEFVRIGEPQHYVFFYSSSLPK